MSDTSFIIPWKGILNLPRCLLHPKGNVGGSDELSRRIHIRLSVYMRTRFPIWNFAYVLFSPRNRTTIAYSCHTNWMIGIKCLYRKLFLLKRYLNGIWHGLFLRCNLRRNYIDQITIAYSWYINWTIEIKCFYVKLLRSSPYSIQLPYKLTDQSSCKECFVFVKGITSIASVQPKLTYFFVI